MVALVALAGPGCARRPAERPSAPQPLSNVLTAGELALTGARDALRAIQIARPSWLAPRGDALAAADRIQIYVESTRYDDASALQQIRVTAVREIVFLDGHEATMRYGAGHAAGLILVRLLRERG